MQFTKDELNHINAFIYWTKTNTEKGVTTIPRHICNNIIKILESIDKDGIEAREAYSKEIGNGVRAVVRPKTPNV